LRFRLEYDHSSSKDRTVDKATYYATYLPLAYAHLATVLPAFAIGTYMMFARKGDRFHRLLGKGYMLLMLVTASISLFMPAVVGPRLLNHFGFIHIFSVLAIYAVPQAYFAARSHNVKAHKSAMIGLYVGGLIIAGGFAFMPGRLLHTWLFA
jgi:uncharacterized membrane protein